VDPQTTVEAVTAMLQPTWGAEAEPLSLFFLYLRYGLRGKQLQSMILDEINKVDEDDEFLDYD